MKGYLAYSGVENAHPAAASTSAAALSRARTRSMLTLIPSPVSGGDPHPPATPKRQRKPKSPNTDAVEYGWTPLYRVAA